jgi:hypothetical protein
MGEVFASAYEPPTFRKDLRNGGFQTWHGHLARGKRAISHETPQGITGKMPVPRYFASPSFRKGINFGVYFVCGPNVNSRQLVVEEN